jgi:hypothetical protein
LIAALLQRLIQRVVREVPIAEVHGHQRAVVSVVRSEVKSVMSDARMVKVEEDFIVLMNHREAVDGAGAAGAHALAHVEMTPMLTGRSAVGRCAIVWGCPSSSMMKSRR